MKIRKALSTLGLLATCLSLNGCGTVINGTRQDIAVASNPSNAQVYLDGKIVGETPTIIHPRRKRDHVVTISKDGYETKNIQLKRVFSGAVAGNLIFGGLPGWGVDAISGGQYRFVEESVSVDLSPAKAEELPATAKDSKEEEESQWNAYQARR